MVRIFKRSSTFFFLILTSISIFFTSGYSQSLSGSSLQLLRAYGNRLSLPPLLLDPPLETAGNVFFNPLLITGLNNGTSWENAYRTWPAINWSNVDVGDTIFISGGTDSVIVTETIGFGKSGTAGNIITIMPGYSKDHNGRVIIKTGAASGLYDFWSGNKTWAIRNYWKLYGLEFQDSDTTLTGGGQLLIFGGTNWTVENCKTNMISGRGFLNIDGNGNGSDNGGDWTVKNCSTYTPSRMREYTNNQEDFIYANYDNTGTVTIEGNYVYLRNKIYVH